MSFLLCMCPTHYDYPRAFIARKNDCKLNTFFTTFQTFFQLFSLLHYFSFKSVFCANTKLTFNPTFRWNEEWGIRKDAVEWVQRSNLFELCRAWASSAKPIRSCHAGCKHGRWTMDDVRCIFPNYALWIKLILNPFGLTSHFTCFNKNEEEPKRG